MFTYAIVCVMFTGAYVCSMFFAARLQSAALQRSTPPLRPGERVGVESLLVDAYCRRVTEDPSFLKIFLDDYLGDATAAKRQAWDQVDRNPDFIRDMVTDTLAKKADERLLAAIAENSKYIPKQAALFEPNVRLAQLHDSRRLLTHVQSRVGFAGLVILLVMILIPPWIRQEDDVTWMLWSVQSREVGAETFVGYRFILAARLPDEIEGVQTGDLGKTRQKRKRTVVALRVLIPQLLFVTILFPIAIYCLRNKDAKS